MANHEHLDILMQGVEAWNQWRKKYLNIQPNFGGANLLFFNLVEADLRHANLNLVNLSWARLSGANLSQAVVESTTFGNVDLSQVKGLETVRNDGPSLIGIDTIYRSQGRIPEVFLRGAGVPNSMIEYMHSLINKPIEYYSRFISFSKEDQSFADRIYADLQINNVRCWFAPEDMRIGDKIRPRIDESIRLYDKLLIVLSNVARALALPASALAVSLAWFTERDLIRSYQRRRALIGQCQHLQANQTKTRMFLQRLQQSRHLR